MFKIHPPVHKLESRQKAMLTLTGSKPKTMGWEDKLGNNCIQIFHLGRYIVGYTIGKFGHTFANSVNPDETAPYEPSHHDSHCLLS